MSDQAFYTSVDLVTTPEALSAALGKPAGAGFGRATAIQAMDPRLLRKYPDSSVVNVALMQEIDPRVITACFDDLHSITGRQKLMFYCCNREEKSLPDASITRFFGYPWADGEEILDDKLYPALTNYSFKPPFFRLYHGPIRHRLAIITNHRAEN